MKTAPWLIITAAPLLALFLSASQAQAADRYRVLCMNKGAPLGCTSNLRALPPRPMAGFTGDPNPDEPPIASLTHSPVAKALAEPYAWDLPVDFRRSTVTIRPADPDEQGPPVSVTPIPAATPAP